MSLIPTIPDTMPSMGNSFVRGFGRLILRLMGWKVTGEIPTHKKMVVIFAPHTSNWDFVLGMAGIMALGLKISYFMKKEAFFWPLKGLFMRSGGIPVDRKRALNVIKYSIREFDKHETIWLGITPEGTRSRVTKWKSGFVRIAHGANVPMCIIGIDAEKKEIIFDSVVDATSDYDAQAEELRVYMSKFIGIRPENQ